MIVTSEHFLLGPLTTKQLLKSFVERFIVRSNEISRVYRHFNFIQNAIISHQFTWEHCYEASEGVSHHNCYFLFQASLRWRFSARKITKWCCQRSTNGSRTTTPTSDRKDPAGATPSDTTSRSTIASSNAVSWENSFAFRFVKESRWGDRARDIGPKIRRESASNDRI